MVHGSKTSRGKRLQVWLDPDAPHGSRECDSLEDRGLRSGFALALARGVWHTSCQLSSSSAPSLTEGAKKGKNPRKGSRWLRPIHNTRVANQPLRTLRMLEGWILRGKEDLQPELNVPGRQNPRCLLQLPRPRLCSHVFLSGMWCSFPRLMFPSFWSSPPWEPRFPVTMSSPFFQLTRCQ